MAQFGSALEWGSRGRKFNSCHPDQQAKLSLLRAKKTPIISVIFFAFFLHRFAQVKRQDSPKYVTLANARYSVATLLTILVTQTTRRSKGKFAPFFLQKIPLYALLLRFSQKAGFLRVAHFVRNNKDKY